MELCAIVRSINAGCGTPLIIGLEQYAAYVLASHDAALKHRQQLLAPFSIGQFYTDGWGAYLRLLDQQRHTVGKTNTQLY